MPRKELPNAPGRYTIEVWREVSAELTIDVLNEDCAEANDLFEAALKALEDGGDPSGVNWIPESTEITAIKPFVEPTN